MMPKNRISPLSAAVLACAALVLAGCGGPQDELQAWMEQQKRIRSIAIKPVYSCQFVTGMRREDAEADKPRCAYHVDTRRILPHSH